MTGLGDLLADKSSVFYFCGIGGVGMRALAMLLRHRGFQVRGSDRVFDQGSEPELRRRFEEGGIRIVPQNGEGITSEISALITSTAVEKQIPDVCRALELGLPVFHRSELLSEIFAAGPAVAVTGTSGKSTVTAMIGHILDIHGFSPTVINGADIRNSPRHSRALFPNLWAGDPSCCVIEADESDGSCRRYFPRVCVITTMSRDHMSIDELKDVFAQVTAQTQEVVVTNPAVVESVREALSENTSLEMVSRQEMGQARWTFRCLQSDEAGEKAQIIVDGEPVEEPLQLQLPGEHNIYNSLLAIAASSIFGIQPPEAVRALASFRGLGRRLEVVGELKEYGIRVIDDFAHNPEKIQASLSTLRKRYPRLLIFFQLHGYGPTRFMFSELVDVFRDKLRAQDILYLPEIYYAGGTAQRDISARDLMEAVTSGNGKNCFFSDDREALLQRLIEDVQPEDGVVIMGARDPSLSGLARQVTVALGRKFTAGKEI